MVVLLLVQVFLLSSFINIKYKKVQGEIRMNKYSKLAKEIIENVGGPTNISNLTHCMTRLRFNLKDNKIANANTIKSIEGVINVIEKGGQFQVVIGTHVADVYEAICAAGGSGTGGGDIKADKQLKWYDRVLDVVSGSFSPIIPGIAGAGMVKAVLVLLTTFNLLSKDSQSYYILNYVSDTAFYFLPFLLAYSASTKFKTSTVISMLLAGVLLHPSYSALKTAGDPVSFLGLPVTMVTYSSSVVPILLIVWAQSYIEKFAKKISPNCVKVFLVPMLTLLITAPIALCILGPLGGIVGDYMAMGFEWLNNKGSWIAPFVIGALTPPLVMTGMHYSLLPISTAQYATMGYGTILGPGMTCSNIAQGIASFAVALRTKDKNLKQIALSSGITGVMGVTEPALYGVNLPLKYPLFSAMIGGGIGGLYGGVMGVKSFASASPGLAALPVYIGGEDMSNFFHAIMMVVISVVVTFIVAYIWSGIVEKKSEEIEVSVESETTKSFTIGSPIKGTVISLEEVNDSVFSSGMMGPGIAIEPTEGKVVSPFDGRVEMLFNTNHAIGLVSDTGIEMLIHIGMDTVNLQGKGFNPLVKTGDSIKKGQVLLTFDIEMIQENGYPVTTPIILTNKTSEKLEILASDQVRYEDKLMFIHA